MHISVFGTDQERALSPVSGHTVSCEELQGAPRRVRVALVHAHNSGQLVWGTVAQCIEGVLTIFCTWGGGGAGGGGQLQRFWFALCSRCSAFAGVLSFSEGVPEFVRNPEPLKSTPKSEICWVPAGFWTGWTSTVPRSKLQQQLKELCVSGHGIRKRYVRSSPGVITSIFFLRVSVGSKRVVQCVDTDTVRNGGCSVQRGDLRTCCLCMTQDRLLVVVNHCPTGMLVALLDSWSPGQPYWSAKSGGFSVAEPASSFTGVVAGTKLSQWYPKRSSVVFSWIW